MCGIAGFSGKPSQIDANAVLDLLQHRGPDGHGSFFDNDELIGLFHTRLSILDVSDNGSQPMLSDCGNVVLIFNGEIYNFQPLKQDLLVSVIISQ